MIQLAKGLCVEPEATSFSVLPKVIRNSDVGHSGRPVFACAEVQHGTICHLRFLAIGGSVP